MINELATVKSHLRVTSTSEDALILLYMDAAEGWITNYLDDTLIVNPSIKAAHLLLVADLYANREAQMTQTTITDNQAVIRLLFPYRKKLGV